VCELTNVWAPSRRHFAVRMTEHAGHQLAHQRLPPQGRQRCGRRTWGQLDWRPPRGNTREPKDKTKTE
jgi:hypothetical protein